MSRFDPRDYPAKDKQYEVSDPGTPGLLLRVNPSGRKVWYWCRVTKRLGRLFVKLGGLDELPRAEASKIAQQHNVTLANGGDPRHQGETITLNSLWSEFFARHSKPNKRSWKDDLSIWNSQLQKWRGKLVSQIVQADVARLRDDIGGVRANRTLALLSKMYEWGNEVGLIDAGNPCLKVKRNRETSRERYLTSDEMRRLSAALSDRPEWFRDYVLLSLYTAQRQANVLAMHRSQIDFDGGVWRIPRQKNGSSHLVPLVPQVVEILRRRLAADDYAFPAVEWSTAKEPHATASTVRKHWLIVREEAGIGDVRLHDLRRTSGTLQAINGVNMATIGAVLGHKSQQATAIYARVNTDAARLALTVAGDKITENLNMM